LITIGDKNLHKLKFKTMKKLIIITIFVYVLLIGMIFKIGDVGIVNPYIQEESTFAQISNLFTK